jgi:anti-sigma-K factor RskA
MNIRDNPVLRDKLAAEYVLGTLRGAARRRFETWLRDDAALRAAVTSWQGHLGTMTELGHPATPPARVWTGIDRRLHPLPAAPWWQFWRQDTARPWAALALAMGGVALAVVLAGRSGPTPPQQIAALTDEQARIALMVTADAQRGRLDVRVARDVRVPDDRTLQLWAIARDGKPRSLGILADNRSAQLALDQRATGADVMLLAISLEPKGGSPYPDRPTGPVLYKGSWTKL